MSGENTSATLLFGISSIETDLATCLEVKNNGNQNILKTIDNYLELLDKAKDTLSLLRDSLSDDELEKIKLVSSMDGECLEIEGDEQIIDRFVAFGIAERNDEESDLESADSNGSSSESNKSSDESGNSSSENNDSDEGSDNDSEDENSSSSASSSDSD